MKKLFILSFTSILLLTGCGATETLSCSYNADATNGTSTTTYDIDYQGEEIKKVRITYKYDFNNDNNTAGANTRIGGDNTTGDTANGTNGTDTTTNGTIDGTTGTDGTTNDGTGTDATTNGTTGTNGTDGTINGTDNGGMTTYNTNDNNDNNEIDGVGTGTDGTTNDSQIDNDGIVDGVIGSAIDTIVGGVTSIILDSAGLRDRHANVQNTYGNINGFSVQNTNDMNDNYTVTYVIDYDAISDDDLSTFNLSRDLSDMRDNYVNQGFTCK